MIRFGSALQIHIQTTDIPTLIYTRCTVAVQHGLGVVRIPPHYAYPCVSASVSLLRDFIAQHQLRLVIHAPMANIPALTHELAQYAAFFNHIACADAVIICHVPHLDTHTATALRSLDSATRHFIALEHTHQPPDRFITFADSVHIPPIFDWLHYHHATPWPYQPDVTLCDWARRWHGRRPLWHMSSQSEHGPAGQHSTRIDSAVVIWMVRSLLAHGIPTDVELESPAGIAAFHRLIHDIRHRAPDISAVVTQGEVNAHS